LVCAVACDGAPLSASNGAVGVLNGAFRRREGAGSEVVRLGADRATARLGPVRVEMRHRLRDSGGGEDVVEAAAVIRNEGDGPQEVEAVFLSSLQPGADLARQWAYLPLSAAGGSCDFRACIVLAFSG
jgi:hypothetical protein